MTTRMRWVFWSAIAGMVSSVKVDVLIPLYKESWDESLCSEASPDYSWVGNTCVYDRKLHRLHSAAVTLALRHFNTRDSSMIPDLGDLQCDNEIELGWINSDSAIGTAVRNLLARISTDKPDIVIGESSSSISIPTSLVSSVYDIPQISFRSTSKRLDDVKNFPRFMRTIPTDTAVAYSICTFWNQNGFRYAGIVYQATDYGEAFKEDLLSACYAMGMKDITVIPLEDPADFTPEELAKAKHQVRKLDGLGLHVFCLITHSRPDLTKAVFEEAYEIGLVGNGTSWILGEAVSISNVPSLAQEIQDAVAGSIQVLAAGGLEKNTIWTNFLEKWSSFQVSDLNPHLPPHVSLPDSFFSDVPTTDAELTNVFPFLYDAIIAAGFLSCKASDANPLPEDFGTLVWNAKSSLAVKGLTGKINFDSIGNRALNTATFKMSNLLQKDGGFLYEHVGTFDLDSGAWEFSGPVYFNEMFHGSISDIVEPAHDWQQDENVKKLCYCLFFINATVASLCFLWTVLNRQDPIVRASQTMFLAAIAIGGFISSSAILPLTFDDSSLEKDMYQFNETIALDGTYHYANSGCMMTLWLYCIGFHLTFGPLFMKTYRVKRLFESVSANFKVAVVVSNCHIWMAVSVALSLDLIILAAFQISDPLIFRREILARDKFEQPTLSTGYCASDHSATMYGTIFALHFAELVAGNLIAYQTRYISTAFQESKYVSMALVGNLQVIALGLPVLVIVSRNPISNMMIRALILFLNDLTVLLCIFLPKFYLVRYGIPDDNNSAGSEWVRRKSTSSRRSRRVGPSGSGKKSGQESKQSEYKTSPPTETMNFSSTAVTSVTKSSK